MTEKELEVVHRLEAAGEEWISVAHELEEEGLSQQEIARIQEAAGHLELYMGRSLTANGWHLPDHAVWAPWPDEKPKEYLNEDYQPEE
jgi:hypothetical protein